MCFNSTTSKTHWKHLWSTCDFSVRVILLMLIKLLKTWRKHLIIGTRWLRLGQPALLAHVRLPWSHGDLTVTSHHESHSMRLSWGYRDLTVTSQWPHTVSLTWVSQCETHVMWSWSHSDITLLDSRETHSVISLWHHCELTVTSQWPHTVRLPWLHSVMSLWGASDLTCWRGSALVVKISQSND